MVDDARPRGIDDAIMNTRAPERRDAKPTSAKPQYRAASPSVQVRVGSAVSMSRPLVYLAVRPM